MKILFVARGLSDRCGGAGISEAGFAAHLPDYVDTTVICPQDNYDPAFLERWGVKSLRPFRRIDVLLAWLMPTHWLTQLIREQDRVHFNGHWAWWDVMASWICRRYQIPYLVHPRGMLPERYRHVGFKKIYNRILGYRFIRNAFRVVALSPFEIQQFEGYRIDAEKIKVLPNGLIPFEVETTSKELKFLYIGRIEARKNLIFLLQAFAEYRNRGGECFLELMGPVEYGYDLLLQKEIERLGLQSKVKLSPPQVGKNSFIEMAKAQAVIYPAIDEAFGRVPFEAVLAGTEVVLPRQSGSADYLARFRTTHLYEQADLAGLAQVLLELRPPSPNFGDGGREWIMNEMNWSSVINRLITNVY